MTLHRIAMLARLALNIFAVAFALQCSQAQQPHATQPARHPLDLTVVKPEYRSASHPSAWSGFTR